MPRAHRLALIGQCAPSAAASVAALASVQRGHDRRGEPRAALLCDGRLSSRVHCSSSTWLSLRSCVACARGSATEVMLATQFRATVSQKQARQQGVASSDDPQRGMPNVWLTPVQEEWSDPPWEAEPPVQSVWPPVHGGYQRPACSVRAAPADRTPAPRADLPPRDLPYCGGESHVALTLYGRVLYGVS